MESIDSVFWRFGFVPGALFKTWRLPSAVMWVGGVKKAEQTFFICHSLQIALFGAGRIVLGPGASNRIL